MRLCSPVSKPVHALFDFLRGDVTQDAESVCGGRFFTSGAVWRRLAYQSISECLGWGTDTSLEFWRVQRNGNSNS